MKATLVLALIAVSLFAIPALAAADDAAPSVTITWPQEGLTIAADRIAVKVTYQAAGDAAVARVSLSVDGRVVDAREIDPAESVGRVSFAWAAGSYEVGDHEITVTATDSFGEMGEQTISVRIERGDAGFARSIRIVSPRSGGTVAGKTPVEVAVDETAVVRYVIFLVDDVFKAMSNVRPFTYVWDTTRYLNGLHELRVKAYLSGGAEALSPTVEVRIDNPSGATAMRAPGGSQARLAAAPSGDLTPARAGRPTLPPPKHTASPTFLNPIITVAEPEVGRPGTAPFVSASGELVRPPSPASAPETGRVQPIQVAALPLGDSPAMIGEPPAVGEPVLSPAAGELSAASAVKAEPVEVRAPLASPIEVALAPPETTDRTTPKPLRRTAPAPEAQTAVAAREPATARSQPAASQLQLAMLPPWPVERAPTPKVTAEPTAGRVVYVVQPGDWLWAIASKYGVSPKAVARANGLSDLNTIHPGQRLIIPTTPVYFDNRPLRTEVPTTIVNGRAIVPFRPVIEEAGGSVIWEPAAKRASAVARGHDVAITIGSDQAQVDGSLVAMGAPAALRNNRAVVPLRFLGDALDLVLQYQDGVIHIASWR